MGAEAAHQPYVAFIDVDIELAENSLAELLSELTDRRLEAIQAQQRSVGEDDYWSRALTSHHRGGRSKRWFGLNASLFIREMFLHYGMDSAFASGEDIEFRYRLEKAGARIGLSQKVVLQTSIRRRLPLRARPVAGRTAQGLGRVVRKFGWPASRTLLIPAGGAVLGIGRSLLRQSPVHPLLRPLRRRQLRRNRPWAARQEGPAVRIEEQDLSPIEIVAESPVSALIAASTVFVAIVHELALAHTGRRPAGWPGCSGALSSPC